MQKVKIKIVEHEEFEVRDLLQYILECYQAYNLKTHALKELLRQIVYKVNNLCANPLPISRRHYKLTLTAAEACALMEIYLNEPEFNCNQTLSFKLELGKIHQQMQISSPGIGSGNQKIIA